MRAKEKQLVFFQLYHFSPGNSGIQLNLQTREKKNDKKKTNHGLEFGVSEKETKKKKKTKKNHFDHEKRIREHRCLMI